MMRILRRLFDQFRKRIGAAEETRSEEIDFQRLEEALLYSINNRQLFREALSHSSYLQVSGNESAVSNERLEFLGDSVLNLVVGEYLFHHRPNADEGELTKVRSRLVNRKALSILAGQLRLADFLLLSPSALQIPGRGKETILSDAFEAVLGAVYLDGGYNAAKQFIERCLQNALERKVLKIDDENFKSQLLEQSQALGLGNPRYLTVSEIGPDHDRTFTVEAFIGKDSCGTGAGKNKKAAEQAAAEHALHDLKLKVNPNGESSQ